MSARLPTLLLAAALAACSSGPDEDEGPGPRTPVWVPPMPVGEGPRSTTDPMEVDLGAMLRANTWEGRLARDARVSVYRSDGDAALAALEAGELDESSEQVATALLAIGEGGVQEALEEIEARALEGTPIERAAALISRGLLGGRPAGFLTGRVDAEDGFVRGCALLGLALAGDAGSRAELERRVSAGGAVSAQAAELLTYADERLASRETPAARLHLDLRWSVARRWGRIDGQRYRTLLVVELARDPAFLDHVILLPAAEVQRPGVADHLLSYLLEHGGPAAARAAVTGMPEELVRLVRSGLWQPATTQEWAALLAEIELRGLAGEMIDVLHVAATERQVRARAGRLLVSAGVADAMLLLEDELDAEEPGRRASVALALGASGDAQWGTQLERMRLDGELSVQMTALVAQVRVGESEASDELRELLRSGPSIERRELVLALCEAGRSSEMLPYLSLALDLLDKDAAAFAAAEEGPAGARLFTPPPGPDAPGPRSEAELEQLRELDEDSTLRLATMLALGGRVGPRDRVSDALAAGTGGDFRPLMVRALGRSPSPEDLALLESLLPDELDLALNIELGLALTRNGAAVADRFLRYAIWRPPFDRSCLAAAAMVDRKGIAGLLFVLETPPERASDADVRRVGFAIGEWGGIDMVDQLASSRSVSDPAVQGAYLGALAGRSQE